MECLYISSLNHNSDLITLNESESRHTKALRLKVGDEILVTNGEGLSAVCEMIEIAKSGNKLQCLNFYESMNELKADITLAVGNLENTDRFEFLLEKSVELGVVEIVPLITKFSSNKSIKLERMEAKIISALKQSKRSRMTQISPPLPFEYLLNNLEKWDKVILADEHGQAELTLGKSKNILVLCGSEGGFSDMEIAQLKSSANVTALKLAESRLRTETAAISAITITVNSLLKESN
ncbi:MAG: 16S rRNA (uracil(1498)-N(3))-methyltransferase [Candidatus Kapaibacterium sp.]